MLLGNEHILKPLSQHSEPQSSRSSSSSSRERADNSSFGVNGTKQSL